MTELAGVFAAADEVQIFCRAHNWRFCFIGGIAVRRWGKPRFTQDVDLTLFADFGDEPNTSMNFFTSSPTASAIHGNSL